MDRAAPAAISPSHVRRVEGNDMMKSPPSCLKSGNVKVYLKKWSIWDKFYNLGTEMRMSKRGRFMFPYCEYSVSGLDPEKNYIMAMDISPVDNYRYRYNGCKWQINGKATPHVMGRLYFHPNGSVSGKEWMVKPVSFAKLRLTNCPSAEEGNAILHSMHRYVPQLHIIVADGIIEKLNLNDPRVYTFVFQQTEFFAVTKYENKFIRQLKHFYNPYGTALRDVKTSKQDVANSRRPRKRCEKKPLFNAVKIHGTMNDQESKEELKTITPIKDGAIKTQECINNQGPMKQTREIVPVENVLQIEGSFGFKGSLSDTTEIENLEQKLREDLRWNGTHEILHPALQKSGIKLSGFQLTECLNLKHLGLALYYGDSVSSSVQSVELNSSFPVNECHGIRETGIPFISRTGKTNDLTKIKGWKHKFNLQPGSPDDKLSPSRKQEYSSGAGTAVIKNRSAFVSDLLDEYLEKEGKIIEQQSLLYDYEMPEIGCQTPTMLDSPCDIPLNTTRSPDFGTPLKNKSSHLEMSPVLEKHFSVTNKGIFIRDVQDTGMDAKARCRIQKNDNSAAKRSKIPSPYDSTSGLSNNNKQSGTNATSPQQKQLKPGSSSLNTVHVVSSPKGGKKSDISGNQTEAIYISDYKNTEELESRYVRVESNSQVTLEPSSGMEHLSSTANRSAASKTVEIISYCTWTESRVKIIKYIAECVMGNKLPSTQRLDKYEIHLEKREGTLLFPPKKHVDVRATIQNFSDSECVFDKPLVQTMLIEAVVGNCAFKTKLNHLISKVSKNSSNQTNVEQLNSPVHVVLDLEKSVSSPEKCPSETSCATTLSNRLTAEDKAQSFPTTVAQKREQGVSIAATDTTVKNVSKAPSPSIRSAITTFQRIGALSTLVTNTTPTPTPSCFVNPVVSQCKSETPSTPPTRYLLCKTNSSGLSSGSADSLDQDVRRHCIAVPNTLKLQPGDSLMLQPIKTADGRQLYRHSSGKIFQLVYTKTPEQAPVQQLNIPQSPILGTSPLVEILTPTATTLVGDANTPHCNTAATNSELCTKTGSSEETSVGAGLCTSTPLCNVVTCVTTKPQLQTSATTWNLADQVSPFQSLFPDTTTPEAGQHNRPYSIIPLAGCQSKANVDELNNDMFDLKMKMNPIKPSEPEEYDQRVGTVRTFPIKSENITVTGAYETKWVPENSSFAEDHKRTDCIEQLKCELNVDKPSEAQIKVERDLSEINAGEPVDSDSSEICTVTIKEEHLNDEEDDVFTALKEESFRSSKFWNCSFNLNTEAVTEAELGVQTHSNRSRDGFGNLASKSRIPRNSLIVNNLSVPHRGFFQNSQSFSHSSKRTDMQRHNARERCKTGGGDPNLRLLTPAEEEALQLAGEEGGRAVADGKAGKSRLHRSPRSRPQPREEHEDPTSGDDETSVPEDAPSSASSATSDSTVTPIRVAEGSRLESGSQSGDHNMDTLQQRKETVTAGSPDTRRTAGDRAPAETHADEGPLVAATRTLLDMQQKVFEPSVLCEARKKAILHNMRERESRRMMENRFKVLKNKLFDDEQIASKGAILDEAIDVITNLDKQSKNLAIEKDLLLGKQKILLEKISLLSAEMGPVVAQGGVEAGEIIEPSEALSFSSGKDSSSQNFFGMKWFPEGGPSDAVADQRTVCGVTVKYEVNSTSSDDIVAVRVGDYLNEKYSSELDYSGSANMFAVNTEENVSQEDCSTFSSEKEECSGSSKFCSFSDYSTDMEALNKMSVDVLGHNEPPRGWRAKRNATPHTLRERESRKLMENRFKLLESTVFNDKKAPKGAILIKAINVISDLDMQSEELFREKELLMKKQKKLLEEISLLSDTRSDATEDQTEDGQFFCTKKVSDVRALTFQKPSETHWLANNNPFDAAVIKGNAVSVLSEHHAEDCTGGVNWEQDKQKANRLVTVKMAGDFKEKNYQEPMYPDGYDPSAVRRKTCNGKDEDALFTVGKESSIGSSDFGSHSDFDINMDEVNEIDVEILSHSESEYADIEMEDGEVTDGTSATEKLCAPPRWHFHNYSQSRKFSLKRKIYSASELRKSRKNPLLHTLREREWRKLMQKRFNELRKLLFEDDRVSKRAILDEAISEIQNLCQQGEKLNLEKKLLMKKHKALLKIISVLSGEKKLKNQKSDAAVCETNREDYHHNVPPGQSLSSAIKGNSEESTLVPIAGTPFHLLLEKIAVSPHGGESGERDCISQTEVHGIKGLMPGHAVIPQQEEAHLAFSEGYSHTSSSTQPRDEMVKQMHSEKLEQVPDTVSTAIDVASRNLKTMQDGEQHVNATGQNLKSTKDLLPSNGGLKKPTQDALYWSKSISKDYTAESPGKDQKDSRSAVKGKLQVIRSTKGQDILQKLAKKVQEAGIKPWTWKSKREDSENAPHNLFDSESKSMQCFQKASTSVCESPIAQYVYTDTTELLVKGKSLHSLLPDQTLTQNPALNRGGAGQVEAELDMDSASSDSSTTVPCAVREPKIFISSVDIHSANEANANGGCLLLDSTQ
ncbi:uncharacterized protein [Heterodontus francisci]|uniref:uncharacterized protein isoform X2 n=1 Tax=Heterodontus francisci TaxID=7792 RepID=UPI00355B9103